MVQRAAGFSSLLIVLVIAVTFVPSASAATCASHPNQASAQRAQDTRDGDGDGIYCESLPCPCAKPGKGNGGSRKPAKQPKAKCVRSRGIVPISFSGTKYPKIRAHTESAIAAGWPRTLRVNRRGADARRARLLGSSFPTKPGFDRDEYPPAVGRGKGKGLERGTNPRGWRASVAYVPSSENRSHGAALGIKLRRYCDGTKFRYVFF